MFMRANYAKQFTMFIIAISYLSVLIFTGCTKTDERDADTQLQPDTTRQVKTVPQIDSAVVTAKDTIKDTLMDITGRWAGTFDKRATTLQITSQDSLNFSGNITINYREVINQQVKGSFNPEAKTFNMKDQLHSRYQGRYNGKLSGDGKKMSGTFTMDLDGKQYPFSFSEK
jgi:Na+/phosphate symporter